MAPKKRTSGGGEPKAKTAKKASEGIAVEMSSFTVIVQGGPAQPRTLGTFERVCKQPEHSRSREADHDISSKSLAPVTTDQLQDA